MKISALSVLSTTIFLLLACSGGQQKQKDIVQINTELASKGLLASKAFFYPQTGVEGLFPEWNKDRESATKCSDFYFEAGLIASSRWMAFEAVVASEEFNVEMMKRLIQTNIIFGDYPVAEKYIDALVKEKKEEKWAEDQRRFLWNDELVMRDSLYSIKRRCIPETDMLLGWKPAYEDLETVVRTCPQHKSSLEILGTKYLLEKDMSSFINLMHEYYGTDALQELPLHFKEAACIAGDYERKFWKQVGVSKDMHKRYLNFVEDFEKGVIDESCKNSYWLYFYKTNVQ